MKFRFLTQFFNFRKLSPTKKMKISEMTLDPFQHLKSDLHSLILDHFTGSDLLELSVISPEWNKIITCYEGFHKKIRLVVDENAERELDDHTADNLSRAYQDLKVVRLFRRRSSVFKVLRNCAESLVSIDTRFDFEMAEVVLPKLRQLSIRTNQFFEDGLLNATTALTKLHISGINNFPFSIVECLKANEGLKELELEAGASQQTFNHLSEKIGIKLTSLKLNYANFIYGTDIERNFIQFLSTQGSLTSIKLLNCDFALFNRVFNGMPNLRSISYSPFKEGFFPPLLFHSRDNIVDLKLILVSKPLVQRLLEAAPNLRTLYVSDPTFIMIKIIMFSSPQLRQFSFAYCGDRDCSLEKIEEYYKTQLDAGYNDLNNELTFKQI